MRPHDLVLPGRRTCRLLLGAAVVALFAPSAHLQPSPSKPPAAAGRVIADFDKTDALLSRASGIDLIEADGEGGSRFLRITSADGGTLKGGAIFNLPHGMKPGETTALAVQLRHVGDGEPARVRWIGIDDKNRIILQRRLDLQPSDTLQDFSLPWTQWRWGDSTGGAPAEIRRIGFQVEGPAQAELHLDDLRLIDRFADQADGVDSSKQWMRRVAFGGRGVRIAEAHGLLVATDAVDQLADADLTRILARARPVRAMVRRVFGDAVRPIEGVVPSLLILRRQGDFIGFFESAGKEWNVRIVPPPGRGMTVQNMAAAMFDLKQGADRPVFVHEMTHAILATDVRVLSSSDQHCWLQEGMAAYVQVCLHPKSLDRKWLVDAFGMPIHPDGTGYFKPLDQLLGRRVSIREYPQIASLCAYLVDEKPQWLPALAAEFVNGRTTEQAFRKCGTTLPQVQAAWMKWGAARVAAAGEEGSILPVPAELRAPAAE